MIFLEVLKWLLVVLTCNYLMFGLVVVNTKQRKHCKCKILKEYSFVKFLTSFKSFNDGFEVIGVFLDISKAFAKRLHKGIYLQTKTNWHFR